MKASKALRLAAADMEKEGRYCCESLAHILGFDRYQDNYNCLNEKEPMKYLRMLKGSRNSEWCGWFGPSEQKENKRRRVIALCFAAAIAESEGN